MYDGIDDGVYYTHCLVFLNFSYQNAKDIKCYHFCLLVWNLWIFGCLKIDAFWGMSTMSLRNENTVIVYRLRQLMALKFQILYAREVTHRRHPDPSLKELGKKKSCSIFHLSFFSLQSWLIVLKSFPLVLGTSVI